jgi:plastocyanin
MKLVTIVFLLALLGSLASSSYGQIDTTIRMASTPTNAYIPDSIGCHVGDTVIFKGSFATHPLVGDAVPSGADPIDPGSSIQTYRYPVKAVGAYKFHCSNHGTPTSGMHGQFIAEEGQSWVKPRTITFDLSQNYPNPVRGSTTIDYNLEITSVVSLKIFSSDGKEMVTLVNGLQPAGHHSVPFDALHLSPGTYFYHLEIDGETITKQLVVTK